MRFTSLISLGTVYCAITIQSQELQLSQRPIMNEPIPALSDPSSVSADVILSDVLGRDRSMNIFAGLTRDISSITQRLEDKSQNTTILAPVNSAITGLPRKPWEDPEDYDNLGATAYDGEEGEARAHRNIRRFVEAHIVPNSPFKEGEKMTTLAGGQIWWEMKDGKKVIQPGNIEVSSVASQVFNGQVWILKNVRNYA
ncbi:FAS1 domain-containing protein [Phlyctema vagabunda]|uniref:FAS1 domain-containing protein n=1 Tax=Phlyctema vagabunda TaxID=108571 RepID=A0ABR4PJE6_9HELO